jgi:hypothetical protein
MKRRNNRHKTVVENLVKQAMATHKMLCYLVDTSYGPRSRTSRAESRTS